VGETLVHTIKETKGFKTVVICAFCRDIIRYIEVPVESDRHVYGVCERCVIGDQWRSSRKKKAKD
jgi:hypothetical protein